MALGLLSIPAPVRAMDGKLGVHVVRMAPHGLETQGSGQPGWGIGFQLTALRHPGGMFAGVAGLEFVNLLYRGWVPYYDPIAQTLYEPPQMSQHFDRLYLGAEIGPHGHAAFRPHAGANLSLIYYGISSDVVIPHSQTILHVGEHKFTSGYDISAGLDVNPWNTVSFDLGVRSHGTFGNPTQLSIFFFPSPVSSSYHQAYLAVAFSLRWLRRGMGR